MCAGRCVSSRSKQQTVPAPSPNEAEFVSPASSFRDVIRFRKFEVMMRKALGETNVESLFDKYLGEDSQACIANAESPIPSGSSRHIDLKYQFPN